MNSQQDNRQTDLTLSRSFVTKNMVQRRQQQCVQPRYGRHFRVTLAEVCKITEEKRR